MLDVGNIAYIRSRGHGTLGHAIQRQHDVEGGRLGLCAAQVLAGYRSAGDVFVEDFEHELLVALTGADAEEDAHDDRQDDECCLHFGFRVISAFTLDCGSRSDADSDDDDEDSREEAGGSSSSG